MKSLIYILILFLSLVSCGTHKDAIVVPEKVVTQVERVTDIRWDTVFIEVPAQSAEVLILDSISHLETEFATSDARINTDGTLYHNLKNKPQERPTVVPTTIQRIDSIVEREVPVIVYKSEPLNKTDQFKISAFWWLIFALLVLLAVAFRNPIWALIKRMIR